MYLCLISGFVITAVTVTSLPVPAVVGIATRGGSFFQTLSKPFICSRVFFGYAIHAPVAFAQSIEEPPPKAIIPWQLFSIYNCFASFTFFTVGFGFVLS